MLVLLQGLGFGQFIVTLMKKMTVRGDAVLRQRHPLRVMKSTTRKTMTDDEEEGSPRQLLVDEDLASRRADEIDVTKVMDRYLSRDIGVDYVERYVRWTPSLDQWDKGGRGGNGSAAAAGNAEDTMDDRHSRDSSSPPPPHVFNLTVRVDAPSYQEVVYVPMFKEVVKE